MTLKDRLYRVRVRGEFALFTRPELKTERVTYEVITPSAARGVVEAILWKPAIRWRVRRIAVLAPIRFVTFRRNEVKDKVSTEAALAMMRGREQGHYYADDRRDQRCTVALRDVDYLLEVGFEMTDRAGPDDNPFKYDEMFRRRLEKGQYYSPPYLGCREFPATVTPGRDDDPPPIPESRPLGRMLRDLQFGQTNAPIFFDVHLQNGVVEIDSTLGRVREDRR